MPTQRSATLADMAPMWTIRTAAVRETCASHYPPEVIETLCATAPPASMPDLIQTGGTVVAEADGRLLGYAALDIGRGEVDAVFVEPGQQGRGIARALLATLEGIAAQHGIARLFLSSSLNAVPFYERAGFSAVRAEVYPHRSGIGIPAVFMEKQLGRPAGG